MKVHTTRRINNGAASVLPLLLLEVLSHFAWCCTCLHVSNAHVRSIHLAWWRESVNAVAARDADTTALRCHKQWMQKIYTYVHSCAMYTVYYHVQLFFAAAAQWTLCSHTRHAHKEENETWDAHVLKCFFFLFVSLVGCSTRETQKPLSSLYHVVFI